MYEWQNDMIYYITLENENYNHPPMRIDDKEGIIKGIYNIKPHSSSNKKSQVQLLASGPMVNEALEASKLLMDDWDIDASVWSVTSYSELHKEAEDVRRWNILHPASEPRKSFLEESIRKENGPVIAISDYVKLVAEQILPYIKCPFVALGTDGFGRSDSREKLREFFEVDSSSIARAAAYSLYKEGTIDKTLLETIYKDMNIDSNKPNPWEV